MKDTWTTRKNNFVTTWPFFLPRALLPTTLGKRNFLTVNWESWESTRWAGFEVVWSLQITSLHLGRIQEAPVKALREHQHSDEATHPIILEETGRKRTNRSILTATISVGPTTPAWRSRRRNCSGFARTTPTINPTIHSGSFTENFWRPFRTRFWRRSGWKRRPTKERSKESGDKAQTHNNHRISSSRPTVRILPGLSLSPWLPVAQHNF